MRQRLDVTSYSEAVGYGLKPVLKRSTHMGFQLGRLPRIKTTQKRPWQFRSAFQSRRVVETWGNIMFYYLGVFVGAGVRVGFLGRDVAVGVGVFVGVSVGVGVDVKVGVGVKVGMRVGV